MSKYREYAKSLEREFLKDRATYAEAAAALEKAEKARDKANAWHEEKLVGQREIERAKAQAAYLEAKANFDRVADTVWREYDREKSRLTAELRAAVAADNTVNPDSVDGATTEILRSGI
ncbi:MAG: hypothetical protein KBS74_07580 [Clostridiales bacterium]|nr:hypothetical protein [Candidatus Cacconaster stercorequi]